MQIGVPREIKNSEARVGLTPGGAASLVAAGHRVLIESTAGLGIDITDDDYVAAGASIVPDAGTLFDQSELIVKVKEPQPEEIARLRPHHILFTYLHLAPDPAQARGLMASGATCIAYETVTDASGGLPLLAPMSQVAGRMATQVGAAHLLKPAGGRGLLLGGVPGVTAGKVVIFGGGVAGVQAAEIAVGMRASVVLYDINAKRLEELDRHFAGRVQTMVPTPDAIARDLAIADLVIGCVLVPGASAPKLVTRAHLATMRRGAVLVDVAIDQGGCFETSVATTHENPTYVVDGVIHYCVANMPGAAPLTSTYALTAVTTPYVMAIAATGVDAALAADVGLAQGLNVREGRITHPAVQHALGL